MMNHYAERFLSAARVPVDLHPQRFGPWWIERMVAPPDALYASVGLPPVGWATYTLLHRYRQREADPDDPFAGEASCGRPQSEIVMEDSRRELAQHLPIWLAGRGRVLVTGLGLGCVVRGLLASSRVEHIDVVELDAGIIRVVGPEFYDEPRVTLHHGDALTYAWPKGTRWDVAWHDLWTDGPRHLQHLHVALLKKHRKQCPLQGAWKLPRFVKRLVPGVLP
jgi:hypothetical protein